MSAESATQVCNLAITALGHNNQLVDLDTDTKTEADLCRLYYPRVRDSVLRAHPWNFAVKRQSLAATSDTPSFEYTYEFTLPTDCLKVIRTSWEATGYSSMDEYNSGHWTERRVPYRIEGRKLLATESTCSIEYIAQITDTSQFDALFTDALYHRLAAELAMPLTQNRTVSETMWKIYTEKLSEARTVDAQEGSAREVVDTSPWVVVRN